MRKRITLKGLARNLKSRAQIPGENSTPSGEQPEFQVNLLDITSLLLNNRKLIVGLVCVVMAATAIIMLSTPNKYKSTASILPSGKTDKYSALRELAGLGSHGVGTDENSSTLYPTILHSNQVKDAVLNREYAFTDDLREHKLTPRKYFGTENPDILRRSLDRITLVDISKKTGVVNISVETKYPGFSQAILNQFLVQLENFNLHKRRSTAKENVQYLESELAQKESELKGAEDVLETYQMANRNWDSTTDPEILKSLSRLQRDIEIKAKTYVFLREQYEIAKLDAQKNIPIIQILDTPSLPTIKSGPHRIRIIILLGVVAFFLTSFFVVVVDAIKRSGIAGQIDIPIPIIKRRKHMIEEGANV